MRRELLISFTGHLALLLIIGIITSRQKEQRKISRPGVITVQILPGSPKPQIQSEPKRKLIAELPKPVSLPAKRQPANPEPQSGKNGPNLLRRAGLGARIEGAAALGYNYYLQEMLERIEENWQDPFTGRTAKMKATVMFVIERNGSITEVKLEQGSGDALYDESCLRSVLVTGKLPPLPAEFTAPRLKIHLEFEK
uniref:TonB C-terminal domain-containing protein n=1 Tax=candidate division WOR-3 bacterium TaxID=2052148 RepID=A0A7V3PTQ3_UNCW3